MAIIEHHISATQTVSAHHSKIHSWVEIDTAAFNHNIAQYQAIVAPAYFAPVIKSNAYGHGIELVAKLCQENQYIDIICVVALSEALMLRSCGITKNILVLSIIDDDLEQAVVNNIELVIFDITTAQELNRISQLLNKKATIHIKIDTGLSRLGILHKDALAFIMLVSAMPHIIMRGIFTHFASSEHEDQTFTNLQIDRFNNLTSQLAAQNIHIPLRHTSCSAAITANARSHQTMARVGIGIYGFWPSAENKQKTLQEYPHFSLRPVMNWKTRIMLVKEIPANSYVGYDQTYTTNRTTRVATLPVGYWDGIDRRLSNNAFVFVRGKLAPIIGRIAMNLMMVDVTEIDVAIGDEVTLLGAHSGITADDIAARCNTINYEIVTRINPLIKRVVK